MKWLWDNILLPLFGVAVKALGVIYQFAFNNPVAGLYIGGGLVVMSWFLDEGVVKDIAGLLGYSILIAGAVGWVYKESYHWFDRLMRALAGGGITGSEGF